MRERNQIEGAALVTNPERAPHNFIQFFEWEKLSDGQFTHWNDQVGLQQIDLVVHPVGAVSDFIGRGNTIATGGGLSRETTADGGEVDRRADLLFVHAAKFLEPSEERSTGRPSERLCQDRFFNTRRLTDEHDLAQDRATGNRWGQHSGATPALEKAGDMPVEQLLLSRRARHLRQRRKSDINKVRTMLTMMQLTIGK